MAEARESNLWTGFGDYEVHRGTLALDTTETVTLDNDAVSVSVENLSGSGDLYVTFDGTEPTSDGSGDTGNKMLHVPAGGSRILDLNVLTVKLRSATAIDYQVIVVR